MAPIPKPKQCAHCGNDYFLTERRGKYCSKECSSKYIQSEQFRNNISNGRKKFLKENSDKHPWKRKTNHPSMPAETVKSWLVSRGIDFVSEMSPLENRSFSIDIAFPHIKVGVEINGNQHYNSDGKLRKYYQDRHDLFVEAGWKIIEVHYSMCYNEENYKKIFDFDIPFDHEGIAKKFVEQQLERKRIKQLNPKMKPGQKLKLKTEAKWSLVKDKIFNHDIDFTKLGWVQKVSEVLCITPQKVNVWMKRYHTEFYNTVCFKRKSNV